MDIFYARCAGLDVHKKDVYACRLTGDANDKTVTEMRKFSTMTQDLLALRAWLEEGGCTHVAMESTGVYWKPIYNLLEGHFELLLVNPQHMKAVPGRKTDVKDAQWIAQLLQHGLLKNSFVPPEAQRVLRDLTRTRTNLIGLRASLVNQLQAVLEDANIKLGNVATDITGLSGRDILAALIHGERDAHQLAELARGRLRSKMVALEAALEGFLKPHHAFLLSELLCQIDSLDAGIQRLDTEIETRRAPCNEAVAWLDTIPGVGQATAEVIVSEVGTDMTRFPTAAHLCAWAGVAPGNHQSAGKQKSGKTRQGNRALRSALVQAAHAAARHKGTFLQARYRRLVSRHGPKVAALAVAHTMLTIAYHLLERKEAYRELGGDYYDKLRPDDTTQRLVKRLEKLGHKVSLEPMSVVAA